MWCIIMSIINNIDQSSFLGIPWQMLEAPLCADDVLDWNNPNSAERRASLWEPRKSKLQPSEFKRRKLAWFGRGLKSLFLIAVSWRKTHWCTELMLHCFLKAESARSAYNFGPKWNMMNPDLLGMIWKLPHHGYGVALNELACQSRQLSPFTPS